MTTPMSHDEPTMAQNDENRLAELVDIDEAVLRQFQALCKGAQMQALFGGSARLADWLQTVALIVLDERHRRKGQGKDLRLGDPIERLNQHTLAMSERDLEAVAMGFARMLEKASPSTAEALSPLINLFYEPVRVTLMGRDA